MTMIARPAAVAACALSLAITADARAGSRLPPDLARAAADYDRAQSSGDRAALERLLAPDYTLVNSGAQVETRAQFIAESTAPGFTLKPFAVEDPVVRVWPDGAVLAGAVTLEGVSDGAPFKGRIRFADVWRKRRGRWQVVFTEVTRIPKP
ncbi:MAG: nuclear transport factor 2 family protein [Caulobacterales bacterium]|jgi:ketosteroid isomerase-like protein